jgi:hypothetical protein
MTIVHGCGRIDDHDGHHWNGRPGWEEWIAYPYRRWVKPRYYCIGITITEGGWFPNAGS